MLNSLSYERPFDLVGSGERRGSGNLPILDFFAELLGFGLGFSSPGVGQAAPEIVRAAEERDYQRSNNKQHPAQRHHQVAMTSREIECLLGQPKSHCWVLPFLRLCQNTTKPAMSAIAARPISQGWRTNSPLSSATPAEAIQAITLL